MKINPIYRKEMTVRARSSKTAVIVTVFNAILALVALIYMSYILGYARKTGEIQYSVFLTIFRYITWIEFAMILLIMPALTSGSISGEREKKTLDLIMTTGMTPTDIILGKLLTALSSMFLFVISSAPIIALVFVYGGVTIRDLLLLFLCYFTAAFLMGSMGIWFSGMLRRTTAATASTYGLEGALLFGTAALNFLLRNLSAITEVSFGLLLFSPLATFYDVVNRMTGSDGIAQVAVNIFGLSGNTFLTRNWFSAGIAIQLLLACLFLVLSVNNLKRSRNR